MAVALQVAAAPVHVVFPIKVSTKSISASRFGTSLTPTRRSKSVVSDWVFPRRCRICASLLPEIIRVSSGPVPHQFDARHRAGLADVPD